ncbi:MAG: hypothetical protein QME62_03080 [Armatimonadota bacterium]|nr:hypothetical protein [Armatimonadota bacterium]
MTSSDVIQKAIQIGTELKQRLRQAFELSTQIMDTIERSDVDMLTKVLDERARVCKEIKQCFDLIESIAKQLRHISGNSLTENAKLKPLVDEIRDGFRLLLEKQTACEDVLQSKLEEYKTNLATLRHHRGFFKAYANQPANQNSRFLDSRL